MKYQKDGEQGRHLAKNYPKGQGRREWSTSVNATEKSGNIKTENCTQELFQMVL